MAALKNVEKLLSVHKRRIEILTSNLIQILTFITFRLSEERKIFILQAIISP